MKNFIPLVLAVVLGLAAVFGIRHLLAERETATAATVAVVVAAQDVPVNTVLTESVLAKREVPRNAVPAKAILWQQRALIVRQKSMRNVLRGDYIQWSDMGRSDGVSNLVGEGEWAISVPFSDTTIGAMLRPGDEIAIVGTFDAPAQQGKDAKRSRVTTTILPRVRIIGVSGESESTIVLSLKPEQAQLLIDAQRVASLYPALRRPNDDTNLDRLKTGMVSASTYDQLLTGQKLIELPAVPDAN